MTATEAAWVGAMIEGEGGVYCYKKHGAQPSVQVCNTEVETIATILRLVGDGNVSVQKKVRPYKDLWQWSLSAVNSVADLLPQVTPYLTGKRERAEYVLTTKMGRTQRKA